MSLFPNEDVLTKVIESWKGSADSLRAEDNELFAASAQNGKVTTNRQENINQAENSQNGIDCVTKV